MTRAGRGAADREQQFTQLRRRLVADPLLHRAKEPELWPMVLRYRGELGRWFSANLGWRLVVDSAGGFARLYKVASQPDSTRPAMFNDTPLTPRKYALVLLACAALDEQPRQTTLSVLAENVTGLAAAEDAIPSFTPASSHSDRLAFAGAVKWMADNRLVTVRDGDLDAYVGDPSANALLDVNDRLLAHLLSCPTSPALVGKPDGILEEVYPSADAGGDVARAGHQVLRRLADDPLIYLEDLETEQRDWIAPRWWVINRLADDLGLALERRAEGFAGVDHSIDAPLSDRRFPHAGNTVAHCALLLAEYLTGRHQAIRRAGGPHDQPPEPVARSKLRAHVCVLIREYASRCDWAEWVHTDEGPTELTTKALDYLAGFRLVRILDQAVVPTPALARFGVAAPTHWEGRP